VTVEDPGGAAHSGGGPDAAVLAALRAQLARAEAERDAALAALHQQARGSRPHNRIRQGVVGFLVVVFCLLLPITFVIAWAHKVALDTDGFESVVGPLADRPAVTAAVSAAVTNQIFTSLNPQQIVAGALPPRASFLAGPVTSAAKGYVQQAVTAAVQSRQFKTLWQQSTRFAHTQLLGVLEGHSQAVKTTNGQVVLDLVPLLNSALQNLGPFISGVVGRPITLPKITSNELPATACRAISNAIHRPVPATCGQIPLFPADKLTQARRAVRLFNGVRVLLLVLTPVVAALALWLSRRRRRTLLQLSAGGVLALVVARRAVIWLGDNLVRNGQFGTRAARQAIVSQVFHQYFSLSRWLITGLVIVFAIALVTGPYAWARSLRTSAAHVAGQARDLAVAMAGRARDDSTLDWIRSHLDLLRILGVVVAVILLLAVSVSLVGFVLIALLLAGYELWLHWLGRSAAAASTGGAGVDAASAAPPDGNPPPPGGTGPARAV
jgi:hypothetical protein